MQFDVKASHIMIGTKSQDPKDTLEAYLKLENIRELIVTGKSHSKKWLLSIRKTVIRLQKKVL